MAREVSGTSFRAAFVGVLAALVAVMAGSAGGSDAVDDSDAPDELTFCFFGPKMKVIHPVEFKDPAEVRTDVCPAPVQVQGLRWECTTADKVLRKLEEFRKQLYEQAKQECERYCKEKSVGKCAASLDVAQNCGLETRANAAVMGKKMGCRHDCSGRALAFCSLYNAGFTSGNPEILAGDPPNCHCRSQ
jgi:hypothetical protein